MHAPGAVPEMLRREDSRGVAGGVRAGLTLLDGDGGVLILALMARLLPNGCDGKKG